MQAESPSWLAIFRGLMIFLTISSVN